MSYKYRINTSINDVTIKAQFIDYVYLFVVYRPFYIIFTERYRLPYKYFINWSINPYNAFTDMKMSINGPYERIMYGPHL